jgi:hypothetical protein
MTRYTPQWLQQGSYAASVDRRLLAAIWPAAVSNGCAVTVASGMTVNVAAGQVAVPTQNSTGSSLCSSDAVEQVTLAAAPGSGTNRYDLVVCQPRGNDLDGGTNNDFVFTTVTGVAAATPTVPAVPAGQVALAQIYVPGGSAAVAAGNITDVRPHGLGPEQPVAAAAPLAAYTDPITSEVWVAKGGVNGGVWRKGRDVLRARMFRNTAFSVPTTVTTVPWDGTSYDDYGLYVAAQNGFVIPVTGMYQFVSKIIVNGTAAGQQLQLYVYRNGSVNVTYDNQVSQAANATRAIIVDEQPLTAADVLTTSAIFAVAANTWVGTHVTYFEIVFRGQR